MSTSGMLGTYQSSDKSITLSIITADDSNGKMSGTLAVVYNGSTYTMNMEGEYHFSGNTGANTSVSWRCGQATPNIQVGFGGWCTYEAGQNPSAINCFGGIGFCDNGAGANKALAGPLNRQ